MGRLWRFADALYFGSVALGFAWAVIDEGLRGGRAPLRLSYRIIIAAVLATVATIPVILLAKHDEGLLALIRHKLKASSRPIPMLRGAMWWSAPHRANLNPEAIIQAIGDVYARGAAVTGHGGILFFVSWRVSILLHPSAGRSFADGVPFASFHLDAFVIWPLIAAFATVLAALVFKVVPVEILGWNLLSICLLLYMGQGYGIIQYHLTGPGLPRSIGPIVTARVGLGLLRPGINAIVAGAIAASASLRTGCPYGRPEKSNRLLLRRRERGSAAASSFEYT
jgi:hypothetical protein